MVLNLKPILVAPTRSGLFTCGHVIIQLWLHISMVNMWAEVEKASRFLTWAHSVSSTVPWQQLVDQCPLLFSVSPSPNPPENRYFHLQSLQMPKCQVSMILRENDAKSLFKEIRSSLLPNTDWDWSGVLGLFAWWHSFVLRTLTTLIIAFGILFLTIKACCDYLCVFSTALVFVLT